MELGDTVVTYNYDSGGLVRRVSGVDTFSSDVYAPRVDYDKFGQRLLVDFGNGARSTYAYDAETRRIASVKASLPNGYTFHDLAFTYDKVGNLTQLQNNAIPPGDFPGPGLGNAIGGPWTKDYAYDQLYRLTTSAGQHATHALGRVLTDAWGFVNRNWPSQFRRKLPESPPRLTGKLPMQPSEPARSQMPYAGTGRAGSGGGAHSQVASGAT